MSLEEEGAVTLSEEAARIKSLRKLEELSRPLEAFYHSIPPCTAIRIALERLAESVMWCASHFSPDQELPKESP